MKTWMRPAAVFLFLCAALSGWGADAAPSAAEIAAERLTGAQELFDSGQYDECLALVSQTVKEYESDKTPYPWGPMAGIYGISALLAFTFRESGYEAEVDALLLKAVTLNPDIVLGSPAVVPPFVLERLAKVREGYLSRFSRTKRRTTVGLFGALVLEPTVLTNPLLLQPGVSYSFNLSESLTVEAGLRFPLQIPLWNSIRGQVGLVWYPAFRIEKISTGISVSYLFGLDNLTTFMHSISVGGKAEIVLRSGLGFAVNAELLRANLIIGTDILPEVPSYSSVPFLGLFNFAFANITLNAFFTF